MSHVVIVGAGAMGLAAAHHALKAGHQVTVVEAGSEPGGMAAHFDFGGLSIERYYHFICKTDQASFDLLDELGLGKMVKWRRTSMGHFIDGRLHRWGDPLALLAFPAISLWSRLRYGVMAYVSVKRNQWDALEGESARDWIVRWAGPEVYERLWKPLFDLKFHEFADNVSAAWIWTRVKRIGRSRRSMFAEELGYLEGGSQTLVNALCDSIRAQGGRLLLDAPATEIMSQDGKVTGVRTSQGVIPADAVISTMPTPLVADAIPALPQSWKDRYNAIRNIGVACLVFKLKRQVTPHFWVNVSEPDIEIPGIVEFSNLRPLDDTVVYVPYYMPVTHPKFSWSAERLLDEAFGYLQRINPKLSKADLIAGHVAKLRHAQPICEPGFAAKIPPIQTPIAGLQVADTCFYYPEDRGISESVRVAKDMVAALG